MDWDARSPLAALLDLLLEEISNKPDYALPQLLALPKDDVTGTGELMPSDAWDAVE